MILIDIDIAQQLFLIRASSHETMLETIELKEHIKYLDLTRHLFSSWRKAITILTPKADNAFVTVITKTHSLLVYTSNASEESKAKITCEKNKLTLSIWKEIPDEERTCNLLKTQYDKYMNKNTDLALIVKYYHYSP